MTRDDVFRVVKAAMADVLVGLEIDFDQVTQDDSLKQLGANSVDRMEVTVMSMEALGIKVPLVEFGGVSDLRGLVDVLYDKVQAAK